MNIQEIKNALTDAFTVIEHRDEIEIFKKQDAPRIILQKDNLHKIESITIHYQCIYILKKDDYRSTIIDMLSGKIHVNLE